MSTFSSDTYPSGIARGTIRSKYHLNPFSLVCGRALGELAQFTRPFIGSIPWEVGDVLKRRKRRSNIGGEMVLSFQWKPSSSTLAVKPLI